LAVHDPSYLIKAFLKKLDEALISEVRNPKSLRQPEMNAEKAEEDLLEVDSKLQTAGGNS
jgi:hypothetical protein